MVNTHNLSHIGAIRKVIAKLAPKPYQKPSQQHQPRVLKRCLHIQHRPNATTKTKQLNAYYLRAPFHSSARLLIADPYKTLGVNKDASASDIKKTYYKLAKKYHPDINKEEGAEEKFHDIQGAYEILSDPEKKQQYDQFGSAAFDQSGMGGGGAGNPFSGGFGGGHPFGGFGGQGGFSQGGFNINFEDLFGSAFRGAGQQSYATEFRGSNIEIIKTISLKEAVFGIKNLKVNYRALDACKSCNSTGLKQGKKKSTCGACGGTGSRVHYSHGGYQMASTCNACEGSGVTINSEDACTTCHGEGVAESQKSTEVDLPPGLLDGQALRLSGYGDAPRVTSGPGVVLKKGDLNIRIKIEKDSRFQIAGNDVVYNAEIPFTTAALGGIVEIPTIDGTSFRLRVSAGTETGRSASIPSKGFPIRNNVDNRGDLVVKFKVKVPRPTSDAQIALLEALAEQIGDKTAKRTNNWGSTKATDEPSSNGAVDGEKDHPSNLKRIENFISNAFKNITHKKNDDKSN